MLARPVHLTGITSRFFCWNLNYRRLKEVIEMSFHKCKRNRVGKHSKQAIYGTVATTCDGSLTTYWSKDPCIYVGIPD